MSNRLPYAKEQPKDGDVILVCGHMRMGRTFHCFKVEGGPGKFTRPDRTTGESEWMMICEKCWAEHDSPEKAITNDFIWKGDEPEILVRPPS